MLGFRAHDFGKFEETSKLIQELNKIHNPTCIQLALNKVFTQYASYEDLSDEKAISISSELNKNNIDIAIIGSYINPIHPIKEIRELEWKSFESAIKKAKYLNCPYIGTETGITNLNDEYDIETFNDKNLNIFYNFLDKMLALAIKNDAIISIEPVSNKHTIASLERTINMIDKFKCDNLKIIYDSVNMMDIKGIKEKDGIIKKIPSYQAQKKFHNTILNEIGDSIIALHIKDFKIDNHGNKIGDLPISTGVMNYKALFDSLKTYNIKAPKILEMVNIKTLNQIINMLNELDI